MAGETNTHLLAARASVVRTADVSSKTVLAVLRLRHQLKRKRGEVEKVMLGEETVCLVAKGAGSFELVDFETAKPLLRQPPPSGRFPRRSRSWPHRAMCLLK